MVCAHEPDALDRLPESAGSDERRMWDTARTTQCQHVLPQRDDVVGQPRRFAGWDPRRGRATGDASRRPVKGMIGVTPLCLDASDRRRIASPANVDRVAAQRKWDCGNLKADLPDPMKTIR